STDGRARAVTGLAVSARVSGFPPTLDRMTRLRAVALAAGLLALAAPLTAQASHRARTTAPATYDVSYPQCGGALPTNVDGGIVGVNAGIVFSANPCLATEWAWAARATAYAPAFY